MTHTIIVTAAEANRSFSKLLRAAQQGTSVTITSHGKPAAKLVPIEDNAEWERRHQALKEMQARWAAREPITIGPWTRDDLYDRDWS